MKGDKLKVLVVIYKTELSRSATLKCLEAQSSLIDHLVIWDNSGYPQNTTYLDDRFHAKKKSYINIGENVPLSKVYNEVLGKFDYSLLTILDQDSKLPPSFIQNLRTTALKHSSIDLFLPIVVNEDIIVSPGNYFWFKGARWKKRLVGVISSKNLMAINSGMTIRSSYLKNDFDGYDERLTLYGIDTFFMLRFIKNRDEVYVMEDEVKHESALLSSSVESMLFRWNNLKDAMRIIHEDNTIINLLSNIYLFYRSVFYAFKYKDLRFVFKRLKITN